MNNHIMTASQLAKYLGKSRHTIYRWSHNGLIPHHKFEGSVFFDLSEVEAIIKGTKKDKQSATSHIGIDLCL